MKKNIKISVTILVFIVLTVAVLLLSGCNRTDKRIFTDTLETVEPDPDTHIRISAAETRNDVYNPPMSMAGYRYGPSIMYYPDGSWDAWFATNGSDGEWDWISYKHSKDGNEWTDEKICLRPTADSMDHYSCCDPGLVYFNGYYYLGYTSTIVDTNGGINNNIFVARSKNPDGPYEKWNGKGWGGDPQPIIYYNESDSKWGAGEISFVVLEDTLYCYYTWDCPHGNFEMVSTADVCDNWPSTLVYRKTVCEKQCDSMDVFYVEDYGKFVAFSTYKRFGNDSGIIVYESDNGIDFTQTDIVRENFYACLHNMGISKRPDGHVQMKDRLILGYAYSDGLNWGQWATCFQDITMTAYDGEITMSDQKARSIINHDYLDWTTASEASQNMIGVGATPFVRGYLSKKSCKVGFLWFDGQVTPHSLTDTKNIEFSGYNKKIISIKGNTVKFKKAGTTLCTMRYKGFSYTFKIKVYGEDEFIDLYEPDIVSFRPVESEMTVYLDDCGTTHISQIRGFVTYEDGTWGEAYNDFTSEHPSFPAMVDGGKYLMTFSVDDESVLDVSADGQIYPKKTGEATATVRLNDKFSFTVKITVKDKR